MHPGVLKDTSAELFKRLHLHALRFEFPTVIPKIILITVIAVEVAEAMHLYNKKLEGLGFTLFISHILCLPGPTERFLKGAFSSFRPYRIYSVGVQMPYPVEVLRGDV